MSVPFQETKSGKAFAIALLYKCYRNEKQVDVVIEHIPAMYRIAGPGQRCTWCGDTLDFSEGGGYK